MYHTGFDLRQAPAHLATGYTDRTTAPGEPLHDASWLRPPYARPSGGSYSTAGDLVRFGVAVMTGSLLQQATFDRAIESRLRLMDEEGLKFGYGLGFEVDRTGGTVRVGHSGGSPGASARLDMYPASGTVVVVLSNLENAAHRVADHISHLLTGNGVFVERAGQQGLGCQSDDDGRAHGRGRVTGDEAGATEVQATMKVLSDGRMKVKTRRLRNGSSTSMVFATPVIGVDVTGIKPLCRHR